VAKKDKKTTIDLEAEAERMRRLYRAYVRGGAFKLSLAAQLIRDLLDLDELVKPKKSKEAADKKSEEAADKPTCRMTAMKDCGILRDVDGKWQITPFGKLLQQYVRVADFKFRSEPTSFPDDPHEDMIERARRFVGPKPYTFTLCVTEMRVLERRLWETLRCTAKERCAMVALNKKGIVNLKLGMLTDTGEVLVKILKLLRYLP